MPEPDESNTDPANLCGTLPANVPDNVPETLPISKAAVLLNVPERPLRGMVDEWRKVHGDVAGSHAVTVSTNRGERSARAYPVTFLRELVESKKCRRTVPKNVPRNIAEHFPHSTGSGPNIEHGQGETGRSPGGNVPGTVFGNLPDRERELYEQRIAELRETLSAALRENEAAKEREAKLFTVLARAQDNVLEAMRQSHTKLIPATLATEPGQCRSEDRIDGFSVASNSGPGQITPDAPYTNAITAQDKVPARKWFAGWLSRFFGG